MSDQPPGDHHFDQAKPQDGWPTTTKATKAALNKSDRQQGDRADSRASEDEERDGDFVNRDLDHQVWDAPQEAQQCKEHKSAARHAGL